jgi:amidase
MSHPDWVRTGSIRTGLRAGWQALFADIDVVICPPMPTPAFPHDHAPRRSRELDIDGRKVPYLDQGVWAGIATLNGLPATTMPVAHDGNLPIGAQIIGGFLDDNTTIALAGMIEREFGGFTAPPGYA